jgi:NADPH-dependent glutamate synthase beta subunit-like oxidoreductase
VTHPPRELTPLPDLLHGAARAGPVRTRRPVYLDLLPPCNDGCPAGENIRDAGGKPGGMMRYGIPAYRLPRDVMAAELDRIAALGVRVTCSHRVEDLAAERREGGFDAVFIAVGAHLSKHVDIPARDTSRIIDAAPFLRDVASGGHPVIGRRVAVYGGGNTAMDAARTAQQEVTRRWATYEEMATQGAERFPPSAHRSNA